MRAGAQWANSSCGFAKQVEIEERKVTSKDLSVQARIWSGQELHRPGWGPWSRVEEQIPVRVEQDDPPVWDQEAKLS